MSAVTSDTKVQVSFSFLVSSVGDGKTFESLSTAFPTLTVSSNTLWGDVVSRNVARRPELKSCFLGFNFHKDNGAWKLADHLNDPVGTENVKLFQHPSPSTQGNALAKAFEQFCSA